MKFAICIHLSVWAEPVWAGICQVCGWTWLRDLPELTLRLSSAGCISKPSIKCFLRDSTRLLFLLALLRLTLKCACAGVSRPQMTGYWGYIVFPFADLEYIVAYFHLTNPKCSCAYLVFVRICVITSGYPSLSISYPEHNICPDLPTAFQMVLAQKQHWPQGNEATQRLCQGSKYLLFLRIPHAYNRNQTIFWLMQSAPKD